ncbi:tyrosine-type recombinase/integrase [Tabrizicola sp. J26]|uniref:tyrosine-type recombinase/integrase n=1 Tax=Alitabrizicola rongguiensis TaxID=2909234 RepID=UPI001F3F181D|nr:tyrosine-type recombinase/integrase [Tabrizicola rongguiensis]MCF1708689.1 tyrosine-type recombinase/integrase [Tabrizicola rongguiensis]
MKRDLPAFCYWKRRGNYSYVWFIRRGEPPRRIKAEPGTADFQREYASALDGARITVADKRTFSALIDLYVSNPAFTELAPRTKADYRKILDFLRSTIGKIRVSAMQKKDVVALRDANADRVRQANYIVQVIRPLLKFAHEKGWRVDNPAVGVSLLKTPKAKQKPHVPWTDEAVAKWREESTGLPRLCMELGIGTVQRPDDLTRFRWRDYDGATIKVMQGKTGVELILPCTEALKAVLDAERARLTPHPNRHILTNRDGLRLTYRRMAEIMLAERKRLGTEEHDLHAMRYRGIMELAWAGCSDDEIASYSGHVTMAMIRKYAGIARQIMRARQASAKRK